jgi:D-alanyl-D-alanine carboxypeptidase
MSTKTKIRATIILSMLVLIGIASLFQFVTLSGSSVAQIIAVEVDVLKKWQEQGALRRTLAYDASGSDVRLLQRMLSQDVAVYPEKKVTGWYGNATRAAVERFQAAYNLPVTGAVDSATKDMLNSIFFSELCPKPYAVHPEYLLRKILPSDPLPLTYVPPELVDISKRVKTAGIACLRSDVALSLERMFIAAKKDGVDLMVTSGYRKPEIQQYLYLFWFGIYGESAVNEIAKPGASEHQLGSTVDLTDASIGFANVDPRFAGSAGGTWLVAHAREYGFILSYPKGKTAVTGYSYEPWHWRFVGTSTAATLWESGKTFNESL